jgi:predicted kinase/predicted phosphodiesterase
MTDKKIRGEYQMRILLILRGAPGCGKTTYIKDHRLIPYTLSFDNIRMLFKSPVQTIYGKESSDRKKDSFVFDTLLMILEERMKSGELTVIDHINSKTVELNQYQELALKYRYKTYLIDFTSIPIQVSKERNFNRMARKRVPDHIVDKVYTEFAGQKIPDEMVIIQPEDLESIWPKPIDLNKYTKIHHIGDIHGCFDVLKEAVEDNGRFKEDECYIFLGDYTDRGPQNAEVILFLKELKDKENVIFCEGNHERWVWNWANRVKDYPDEFAKNTKKQLEAANIAKKDMRKFYRKLNECCYYTFDGRTILACHGGIAAIPQNLATISSHQLIHGVGLYSDLKQITNTFKDQAEKKKIEIFGHRNPDKKPMKFNDSAYCLEGGIEAGGCLRWLVLENGNIIEKEYRNVR